jgi:iron complex transport system ATP-binding protein
MDKALNARGGAAEKERQSGAPAFYAAGLSYRFDGETGDIINGLNFEIEAGSFVSIVGPNGAGKSTLLNIMLGYNKNYGGRLEFFGRELSSCRPGELALKRAYIPQQSEEGLRLDAYQYLKLANASPANTKDGDIDEMLKNLNISHLKKHDISLMSGGEARLTQLAFALLRKPEALLLDEPVSYLDYKNQQVFFDLLKKEHKNRKITVVSILHDLDLAAYYSDKIMLINDGRLLKFARPAEVLNYKTLGSVFFAGASSPAAVSNESRHGNGRGTIHVICGGGSGEKIILKLLELNFSVTCGVLNAGDSDWRFCRANGAVMVEEEPYGPVTPENYIKNIEYIKKSLAVVVCAFPLGVGNLANLKFIDDISQTGPPEIICAGGDLNELDFTGGAALKYLDKIKKRAALFNSMEEFEQLIQNINSKN